MSQFNPHSEEAERAVLAAILLDPDQIPALAGLVDAEDFFLPKNVRVFEASVAVHRKGQPLDWRTLAAELDRRGVLESVGGPAYLGELIENLPDLGRLPTYAGIVREYATRRRAIEVAQKAILAARGVDQVVDVPALLSSLRADVDRLQAGVAVRDGLIPGVVAMTEAVDGIDRRRLEVKDNDAVLGQPSGFRDLDAMTDGFLPGQLIVVAGRPGMGKSALAKDFVTHTAHRLLGAACVFNLEMTNDEFALRVLSGEAWIPLRRLKTGLLSDVERRRRDALIREFSDIRLSLDDSASQGLDDIAAKLTRFSARHYKPELVVVDYLQLVEPDRGRLERNRNEDVSRITRGLKKLAKELGVPIVALSQLSRELERRPIEQRRPLLSDLRDSGSIEQDADIVLFLYRHWVYDKAADITAAELIVAKHRQGETGTIDLVWRPDFVKFVNPGRQGNETAARAQDALPW